jgi:neurotransmitter:Na+ symporter, NSS family
LKFVTPIVLAYMMFDNIRQNITSPYGDGSYSASFLFTYGWLVAAAALVVGVIFMLIKPFGKQGRGEM